MSTSQHSDPFEELHRLEETFYQDGYKQGHDDGSQLGRVEGRVFGSKRAFERFFDMARMHGHAVTLGNRLPDVVADEQRRKEGAQREEKGKTPSSPLRPSQPSQLRKDGQQGQPQTAKENAAGSTSNDYDDDHDKDLDMGLDIDLSTVKLRPLAQATALGRLEKHVRVLYALTEPGSLAVANAEEAVSDFDDRFRRAQARETIIAGGRQQTDLPSPRAGGKGKAVVAAGGRQRAAGGTGQQRDNGGDKDDHDDMGGTVAATPASADIEDVSILKARH